MGECKLSSSLMPDMKHSWNHVGMGASPAALTYRVVSCLAGRRRRCCHLLGRQDEESMPQLVNRIVILIANIVRTPCR